MGEKGKTSSYAVFMDFVTEEADASGILSRGCYDKWVSTRKNQLKQPEESFRRVLTAHVCGLIGRKPFPADVEATLLRSLRKKQVWPCFTNTSVTIGVKGFRKLGFHEARRGIFGPNAGSSLTSSPRSSAITAKASMIKLNPNLLGSTNNSRRSSSQSTSSRRHSISPTTQHPNDLNSSHHYLSNVGMTNDKGPADCLDMSDSARIALKRRLDALEPFNLLGNVSGSQNMGLVSLPSKRFRGDTQSKNMNIHEQLPLQPGLWNGMNPNFFLTSFQDVHVPTTPTNAQASDSQLNSGSWPFA